MKKHELIKYAYDNYPKGTKFSWRTDYIFTSDGSFEFPFKDEKIIYCNGKTLFDGLRWAEIVNDKPKEIHVPLLNSDLFANVSKKGIVIKIDDLESFHFEHKDIEDISHALKQLNS